MVHISELYVLEAGVVLLKRARVESAMTALAENLERLEAAIAEACRKAGRERGEVELMAVSKTFPAETIAEAAALGLTLFGENRVQEFAAKAPRAAELWTREGENERAFI